MANDVSGIRASSGTSGPAGAPPVAEARRRPRLWWPITILAAVAALVAGVLVQRAVDHHRAAITAYRVQVNSTLSQLGTEADRQLARPASQRSLSAIDDLADSISQDAGLRDPGLSGSGLSELDPLIVALGSGSIVPAGQIAFEVTITTPYAESTIVVWDIRFSNQSEGSVSNQGACVLTSSLLGPGRARTDLNLGGNYFVQPCLDQWWSPGPIDGKQPRLSLANIPETVR
jgi:hypothetical protein